MKGYAYVAACCATKHGVIGLTRALVLETVKNGVVVVDTVCPGYNETALTEEVQLKILPKKQAASKMTLVTNC